VIVFHNPSLGESAAATIPAPPQGFANLNFDRGKIGPKKIRIARIVRATVKPPPVTAPKAIIPSTYPIDFAY
jgi:hypothetical protein